MDKISLIKQAIVNGTERKSKLIDEVIQVPFLGSLQIRHLLNNLGELAGRYLEVGCHKGGSFCSTVFGNYNIRWSDVVDNFESDRVAGETAEFQFLANALFYRPKSMELRLHRSNCFDVDLNVFQKNIDLYLFDGPHEEEAQAQALTYYKPVLADEFIYCCDDYDWEQVQKGTQRGIKEAGFQVLFEEYLPSKGSHDNESWHCGFYVALLKKK